MRKRDRGESRLIGESQPVESDQTESRRPPARLVLDADAWMLDIGYLAAADREVGQAPFG